MDYQQVEAITSIVSGVYVVVVLLIAVITVAGFWVMFTKAGEPGWASIIPFYNTYTLSKIATGNGWLFLLLLIPCVNIFMMFFINIKLAAAFGKSTPFMILMIFFPSIGYLILGLGSSQYVGPQ